MGREIYSPESIPIPIDRQEELAEGWRDLPSERWPHSRKVPPEDENLQDRYQKIVAELPGNPTKKEQIIALYLVFSDEESVIHPSTVADLVGCTTKYARSFNYIFDEQVVLDRNGLSVDLRDQALGEDEHKCVKCGSEDDLEVHHIIPYIDGGEDTIENLATLCQDCHREAHGDTWGDVNYDSKDDFWEWVRYSTR